MFLKKIINSIADAGKELLGKRFSDKKNILELCDDLISFKGVASGIAIARQITEQYKKFNNEEKLNFFTTINKRYKANLDQVKVFAEDFINNPNEVSLNKLNYASEGLRQELIRRINMAPNGTTFLVSMRQDLLTLLNDYPELKTLDEDIRHLFKSWFNPGFLRLEKITWDSKGVILEKIMKYEKVHQIKDMNDLKRRLQQEDRRFFAYFHPVLEDEPLIFVEVAFTKGIGRSIQDIIKPKTDNQIDYNTATFYSISNCQEGLTRVTLGNFLIKRVVFEIQEENKKIKNFGTLSPIPGFSDWFFSLNQEKLKNILKDYNISKLDFLKSPNLKIGDPRIVEQEVAIKKIVAHYLVNEKIKNKPLNQVSRFHLGNGAGIYDIIINGNISDYGLKESFGIMVNYYYNIEKLEKVHENFVVNGKIEISKNISKYLSI